MHCYMKKIFYLLKKVLSFFYDLKKDLKYNEDVFNKLNINTNKIKEILKENKLNYYSQNLSWHFHTFCGLKQYFANNSVEVKNILEIGTYDGNFTNFISDIFNKTKITSIDLSEEDNQFINSYRRQEKEFLKKFLEKRSKNTNKKNIEFIKLNSINILNRFIDKKFEIIWIDGDHHNPQVTIDIINSLSLLSENGIICVDDIIKDKNFRTKKVSGESYETLTLLEKNKIINNQYVIKRVNKNNFFVKKFISISKIIL